MVDAALPLITGDKTHADVTRDVCRPLEGRPTRLWWSGLAVAMAALGLGVAAVWYQIATGIGTWGLNRTVGWGFDITNFVFWVGIGHAGTLISAVLLLFRQKWRTSINRSAEAMTIFAVLCAAAFPVIHMGRPWLAFWVFPYPNTRGPLWVNFRSALLWDVFAIGTYFTISLVFWYVGLIPDLATMRDRARGLRRKLLGWLSCGWTGSARTWSRYETCCVLLAALATPLVVSVHSVVSFDFAVSVIPGWHTTIFPPYFVAGAIYAGFAMVLTLAIPLRKLYGLEDFITMRHLQNMAKIMLATGLIVAYGYVIEAFMAWYSGNTFEQFMIKNRMTGPYAWAYWALILCNVLSPQMLWFRKVRSSPAGLFVMAMIVSVGMWLERYVIIVVSLHRDFLPSSWGMYSGTLFDWSMFIGSIGLFLSLIFLFIRFLPMISIFEMRTLVSEAEVKE
jgi:molybdopterin-containing oxidoreductase family membrane subunit